jgi:hypothetical protein
MSGCGRSGEPENGLSLAAAYGADLCLHKPVNPGVLLEKVSGLLQTPST